MNWKLILLIFGIVVLLNLNNVNAIDIDNCISVQNDTIYILNQSFTTNQSKCFDLSFKENIIIDGNGYFINYTRILDEHLLYSEHSNDITIKNLKVYGWGFNFQNTDNLIIMNNNFTEDTYNFVLNISNVWFYNNDFYDYGTEVQDQLLNAKEYISNLTMNNNNFTGKVNYGGVFSIYNTLHNASIYNNYFNTDYDCLTLGYRHGNNYVESSGNIKIYNNEFYMDNINSFYALGSYAWGNVNISIYDNIIDSNGIYAVYVVPRNSTTNKIEIYNNEFIEGGYTFHLYIYGSNGKIDNLTIRNNLFNNNGSDAWSLYVRDLENITIENNIMNTTNSEFSYYLRNLDNVNVSNETMLKSSLYGLLLMESNFGNITNSLFNSSSGFAIASRTSNNLNIENCEIYGENWGLRAYVSGNAYVYNSIIDSLTYDVKAETGGNITLYNTSINTYDVIGSNLDVYWKLILDNPFNSSVKLYDSLNNLLLDTTNETLDLWIKQYNVIPTNQKTDLTPHNLEWEKSGYYDNFTSFSMNTNKNFILYLIERANITFQLPFEITGMYLSESRCLDNETLYREYKKESCIYTECYELSDVQTIVCPYGCREDITIFGDECFYPDYQTYSIIIGIIIIIFIGLGILSKR